MSRVSENSRPTEKPLEQPKIWWGIAVALPVVIAVGALGTARIEQLTKSNTSAPVTPVPTSISAVGRLEPRGEVIKLSAPTSGLQASSRVEQILVKEGERVRKGQIIAVLDSHDSQTAAVEEAKAKMQEARANLSSVKAGSPRDIQAQKAVIARLQAQSAGERDAQQATIARIAAQLSGEKIVQQATVNRLEAELQGQRDTLRATVNRVQAEANNAQVDARRYESLYRQGAISQQEWERRRLSSVTTQQQVTESQASLRQAKATLQQQLAEARANQVQSQATLQQQLIEAKVNRDKTLLTLQKQIDEENAKLSRVLDLRPTDAMIAQAQVSNAVAVVRKAQAQLKLSYVAAPIPGEILKIHTKAGENMSVDGIAEIGRTDQMIAIAEIPEDSIGKVRLGQKATISSDNGAFNGQLQGTVVEIGRKIGKKDVLNTDPAADVDARVVEVKIALPQEASQQVAGLTNAKIVIEINI